MKNLAGITAPGQPSLRVGLWDEQVRADDSGAHVGAVLTTSYNCTAMHFEYVMVAPNGSTNRLNASCTSLARLKAHWRGFIENLQQAQSKDPYPPAFFDSTGRIRSWHTADPLPADWVGIVRGEIGKFWAVGREGGERSFTVLQARTLADAYVEVAEKRCFVPDQ